MACGLELLASKKACWIFVVILGFVLGWGRIAGAQEKLVPRSTPTARYFAVFEAYYDGEFRTALKAFEDELRGGIKTPQVRWIDSICYHTMVGECYYALGLLDEALSHYTAALQLYLAYPDWLMRVQFPATIGPAQSQVYRQVPWGPGTRRSPPGHFPREMLVGQGRLDNLDAIRQGGVVQWPVLLPVCVQEIVRCTTLAIRRRAELLGPLAEHDPLTTELIAVLSRSPCPPNHWSQSWVDIQYALALMSGGKTTEALPLLHRGLLVVGQYDHPLTATALLELGRLALARGDFDTAANLFHEASISAFYFEDGGVLEEAFRYAALTHLLAKRAGVLPLLGPAASWAQAKDFRLLRVSLLAATAEQLLVSRQSEQALGVLEEADTLLGRREMGEGRWANQVRFLQALAAYQRGQIPQGDALMARVLEFMRRGSVWLFQIRQVDQRFTSGQITNRGPITPRSAMELYTKLLRDPQPSDWIFQPLESLSILSIPHSESYENWFLVALARNEFELAVEIADRARRHRFWSVLPWGGRILNLRWVLEAPEERLSPEAILQRKDLLSQWPEYVALMQKSREFQASLRAAKLAPTDGPQLRELSERLNQWMAISRRQEVILREMALRRQPADMVFPPAKSLKEIREGLPEGHALLVLFAVGRDLYAFLINREQYDHWQVKSPEALMRRLAALLRALGQYEANREMSTRELSSEQWKTEAAAVLQVLVEGSRADLAANFPELVVVPDGVGWYVPFELLTVNRSGQLEPLLARVRIRYVPTASLATPTMGGRKVAPKTLVALGKLHPQEDSATAEQAYQLWNRVTANSEPLLQAPTAPSNALVSVVDQLLVWDDLGIEENQPLGWVPIQAFGRGPGNSVADWLELPWGGPDVLVLPGFHTPVEAGLRRSGTGPLGGEIFVAVTGLMSSGTRTLLLSRWRTGGRTCMDLVREFVQELPHTTAAEAWQRAVLLAQSWPLVVEQEPRVSRTASPSGLKASHPFFWAGYMLIDCGLPPEPEETPAEPPAAEMVPAEPRAPEGPPAPPLSRPEQPRKQKPTGPTGKKRRLLPAGSDENRAASE